MKSSLGRFVVAVILIGSAYWLVRWTRVEERFYCDPATKRLDTGFEQVSTGAKPALDGGRVQSAFSDGARKAVQDVIRVRPDQRRTLSRGTIQMRYTAMTYGGAEQAEGGEPNGVRVFHDIYGKQLTESALVGWHAGFETGAFQWNGEFPRIRFGFELSPSVARFKVSGFWLFDSRTHVRIAPDEFEIALGTEKFLLTCDLWKWHPGPVDLFIDLTETEAPEGGQPAEGADPAVPLRLWFHLPDVPGLPRSNRDLNNLFKVKVPRLRLPSVNAHRLFLSRALQLTIRGKPNPDVASGRYPANFEAVSLRDLLIDYAKLYPQRQRIKVDPRTGVVLIGDDSD